MPPQRTHTVGLGASETMATMHPVETSQTIILPSSALPHEHRSCSSSEKSRQATAWSCSERRQSRRLSSWHQTMTSEFSPRCPEARNAPRRESASAMTESSCPCNRYWLCGSSKSHTTIDAPAA